MAWREPLTYEQEDAIFEISSVASFHGARHTNYKVESKDGRDTLRYGFLGTSPVFVIRRSGWKRYVVFHNEPDKKKLEDYLCERYSAGAELVLLNHGWSPNVSKVASYATVFLAMFFGGYDLSEWSDFTGLDRMADYLLKARKLMNVDAQQLMRNGSCSPSNKNWVCVTLGAGEVHLYSTVELFPLYKRPTSTYRKAESFAGGFKTPLPRMKKTNTFFGMFSRELAANDRRSVSFASTMTSVVSSDHSYNTHRENYQHEKNFLRKVGYSNVEDEVNDLKWKTHHSNFEGAEGTLDDLDDNFDEDDEGEAIPEEGNLVLKEELMSDDEAVPDQVAFLPPRRPCMPSISEPGSDWSDTPAPLVMFGRRKGEVQPEDMVIPAIDGDRGEEEELGGEDAINGYHQLDHLKGEIREGERIMNKSNENGDDAAAVNRSLVQGGLRRQPAALQFALPPRRPSTPPSSAEESHSDWSDTPAPLVMFGRRKGEVQPEDMVISAIDGDRGEGEELGDGAPGDRADPARVVKDETSRLYSIGPSKKDAPIPQIQAQVTQSVSPGSRAIPNIEGVPVQKSNVKNLNRKRSNGDADRGTDLLLTGGQNNAQKTDSREDKSGYSSDDSVDLQTIQQRICKKKAAPKKRKAPAKIRTKTDPLKKIVEGIVSDEGLGKLADGVKRKLSQKFNKLTNFVLRHLTDTVFTVRGQKTLTVDNVTRYLKHAVRCLQSGKNTYTSDGPKHNRSSAFSKQTIKKLIKGLDATRMGKGSEKLISKLLTNMCADFARKLKGRNSVNLKPEDVEKVWDELTKTQEIFAVRSYDI